MVQHPQVLLVHSGDCLASGEDGVGKGPLDAANDRVRDGHTPVLVAGSNPHPGDEMPELGLLESHPEVERMDGGVRQKTEPSAEAGDANGLALAVHLKLDELPTLRVLPKVERRDELACELVVTVLLDAPKGRSEPDPRGQTVKLLADPECLEGIEVNPASVQVLALLEAGNATPNASGRAVRRDVLCALRRGRRGSVLRSRIIRRRMRGRLRVRGSTRV